MDYDGAGNGGMILLGDAMFDGNLLDGIRRSDYPLSTLLLDIEPNFATYSLYVKGRVLGHKRGKRNSRPNTSLVQLEGVDSKEAAQFYLGKVSLNRQVGQGWHFRENGWGEGLIGCAGVQDRGREARDQA
jgi:hypothetical protein